MDKRLLFTLHYGDSFLGIFLIGLRWGKAKIYSHSQVLEKSLLQPWEKKALTAY